MKAPRTKRVRPETVPVDGTAPVATPRAKRARPNGKNSVRQTTAAPAESIAEVAHRLFVARGGSHGHDLDDWLEAERQVLATMTAP
jgi:hypothetical protein